MVTDPGLISLVQVIAEKIEHRRLTKKCEKLFASCQTSQSLPPEQIPKALRNMERNIIVSEEPDIVYATKNPRYPLTGKEFGNFHKTHISCKKQAVTITEFGALAYVLPGEWVFSLARKRPFETADFERIFHVPGARLEPGIKYALPLNYSGMMHHYELDSQSHLGLWYYLGQTDYKKQVMGYSLVLCRRKIEKPARKKTW